MPCHIQVKKGLCSDSGVHHTSVPGLEAAGLFVAPALLLRLTLALLLLTLPLLVLPRLSLVLLALLVVPALLLLVPALLLASSRRAAV